MYVLRCTVIVFGVLSSLYLALWSPQRTAASAEGLLPWLLLAGLIFLAWMWLRLERFVWNKELQSKRLSSNEELWGVSQFPNQHSRD